MANEKQMRSWVLAWLLALSATSGCATTGSSSPTAAPITYRTSGVGAARYVTTPPKGPALRGPHAERVGQAIERAATKGIALTGDPRLAELARLLVEHQLGQKALPPADAIDLWTRHLGLWEPIPLIMVETHHLPDVLTDRIAEDIERAMTHQRYTHYGAFTAEIDGAIMSGLVMSARWAELEPVWRELRKGAAIKVRGELAPGLSAPQVVVVPPAGDVERLPAQSGRRFAFEVPAGREGEYRVELLADSAVGSTVIANFPVYAGVRPRTELATDTASTSGSAEVVHEKLFELIQADRQRAGRKPLARMEALDGVALAHSIDMRDGGFVGHTSKKTGTVVERVQRAGLRVALLRENVGRGYSAEGVHRGLMDSPGHRDNILSPDVSHVGIGVVEVAENDTHAYLVTEVFTLVPEQLADYEDARDELLDLLATKRKASGLDEARHDEAMSELCAAAAREFFTGGEQRPLLERLSRKAASSKLPYRSTAAMMIVVTSLEQASGVAALLDPKAKGIGIGIAQGTRSDTVENAIAVVVLFGY